MASTLDTPVLDYGPPDLTADQLKAAIAAGPYDCPLGPEGVDEWVDATLEIGVLFYQKISNFASQMLHETGYLWTRTKPNQVDPSQYNFGGIGADNSGAAGDRAESIRIGVLRVACHRALYIWGRPEQWPEELQIYAEHAVRLSAVEWAERNTRSHTGELLGFFGTVSTIGDFVNGRWAETSRLPLGTLENGYARAIARIATELAAYPKGTPQMSVTQVTNRTIETLRGKGLEVIDERQRLKPVNGRYREIGLSSVRDIVTHWTGDRFSKEFFNNIGIHGVSNGQIPPSLTVEQEQKLVDFYHRYHGQTLGWPGIAYAILVFPSGRVYVCHDIGIETYHAFNANARSVAVSCPNSLMAEPHYPQLVSLNIVWQVLAFETPEIPAGSGDVRGHNEMGFIDPRNSSTSCPGTFLPHVRKFRETGKPSVELPGHQPAEHGDPHAIYFEETGHWLAHGFRGYWHEGGGLPEYGYPISEEFYDDDLGCTVQWFERARFEHRPDIANNPYGTVKGLVGSELVEKAGIDHPAFARVDR